MKAQHAVRHNFNAAANRGLLVCIKAMKNAHYRWGIGNQIALVRIAVAF